jgi:hypothetical protein
MDRLSPARDDARLFLVRELPTGTPRAKLRGVCQQLVTWVFDGGKRPEDQLTDFIRQTVKQAVNAGIEHAYGETHRDELDQSLLERLASL